MDLPASQVIPFATPPQAILSEKQIQREVKRQARDAITDIIDDAIGLVPDWLKQIEKTDGPGAAMSSFLKLLEFGIPKLARKEVVGDNGEAQRIIVTWQQAE